MKKRTKKTLSVSGSVCLRMILATVLCAILYFSMLTIATGMFSDVVGYQIHEMTDDDKVVLVEEHTYKEGEKHLTKADVTDDQVLTELRKVPDKTLLISQILSQIMMLIVLAIFPYHILWEFGNRDDTKVRYKGQRIDLYRGFRVGIFATIPYAVLWTLLWLVKYNVLPRGYLQVYRVATIPFMPFVQWVLPTSTLQNVPVWQLFLLLPMLAYLPMVCGVSYRLGHKQFSIREHLVFTKKGDSHTEES